MKLRFIFFSLLFSVILLSCGWQIPEKISVKSNASYNFTTGEIDTKLNDSLNFDELIKPDEDSEFTVYNYLPDGKSRQFVMRMAVADIPIDLESSFNESSINEAIKDLSFTQEIKVPSISFSNRTEIPPVDFSGVPINGDIPLNNLEFSFTLNDTESDIFDSCKVKQGKLFTEIIIPSDWTGVSVSYSFSTTGGLEVSDVNTSGQKKTINLAGKTITKDQVNATAQITLTVQPSYKVSSSPLMLKISSYIESLETLNVKLSGVTTSFDEEEPLPEEMKNAFSKIYLNSSGVKIDYVNTLPAENDIKLTVNSDFFGLSNKTGDLKANTQGELELLSDFSKEIVINDSSSYDFDVNISLPGATEPELQKVSLKNVKFGDTYQISMNITPVLNWKKIVLKDGFASALTKKDKKALPFNINELLSSVSEKISDKNLFANIEIKSLPIYVFFTKPQTNGSDLFTNSNFTGKMSVYYGTDSNPKQEDGVYISQTLVDTDSGEDEKIPKEIGFVDYPELNISEDNKKVLSSLDNVSFSLKGDVAKIINSAIKDTSGSSNSLYVDYNLKFTNDNKDGLEILKTDLATKGSIGVYIYIVLPFEFRVSEEVNVSAQKLLNDTIDGDIFGRKSKDDFVNVEDYFALINSASVYYEFTKLPVCSDDSDSIAFDIGMDCGEGGANKIPITKDSSIRKGTITISKKNVEDMLKEYPVKPTMNLSIKKNSEFYIPQIFDVAVKLNLNIQTDGEIEIFGGQ
ncbi:MAG: hypothetical protein SPH83_06900 [Treponema sp.]|nr:hypothetical protein [Spirochaetales bacterium]MDY6190209.1 hypothetical protein [Treponema sp.]